MQKLRLVALAIVLTGLAAGANAQTIANTDIVANTTWGNALNPSPIIVTKAIFVKNGATLTILAGTVVRGYPRSGPVVAGSTVGTPGAIIVTQTGRIVANGTPTSPIIMTTAAVDNGPNGGDGIADDVNPADGFYDSWQPGDAFLDDTPATAPLAPLNAAGKGNVQLWGSLVLLGNAPTNLANKNGVGFGKGTVEGFTVPGFPIADVTYGGIEPHDNSGSLRYVSLRHGGDEIGNSNELNGVSLAGVGDGTTIDNVEVYCNFDDGVEWFGGTVNGSHLIVSFQGDDAFDLDEGYNGVNQFLFGVMPFFNNNDGTPYGSASGDKLGEYDGDNFRPDNVAQNDNVALRIALDGSSSSNAPAQFSNPAMYNQTLIGSTPDGGVWAIPPVSVAAPNQGIQGRNGFAGNIYDSIVINTGITGNAATEKGFKLSPSAATCGVPPITICETPGYGVTENVAAGLIALACTTLADGAPLGALENTAVANGDALEVSQGGLAGSANTIYNAAFPGLVNEDQSFNPQGNASGKLDATLKPVKLDPRPKAGLTGTGGCVAPNGPGLAKVVYRGAFDRTASTLWTTPWTAMNAGGILAP